MRDSLRQSTNKSITEKNFIRTQQELNAAAVNNSMTFTSTPQASEKATKHRQVQSYTSSQDSKAIAQSQETRERNQAEVKDLNKEL